MQVADAEKVTAQEQTLGVPSWCATCRVSVPRERAVEADVTKILKCPECKSILFLASAAASATDPRQDLVTEVKAQVQQRKIIPLRQVLAEREEKPVAPAGAGGEVEQARRASKQAVLTMALNQLSVVRATISRLSRELGVPDPEAADLDLRDKLKGMIWQAEWGGKANPVHYICPWCGAAREAGHDKGCEVPEILR